MGKSGFEIVITDNRIPELQKRFPEVVQAIVDKTAFDLVALALGSMRGPKHGLLYPRGKKMHRASAPGEAPAMDTGNLANSFEVEHPDSCEAIVSVHGEYAQYLEFGTEHMAPRPFLTPAANKVRGKFLEALEQLEAKLK